LRNCRPIDPLDLYTLTWQKRIEHIKLPKPSSIPLSSLKTYRSLPIPLAYYLLLDASLASQTPVYS